MTDAAGTLATDLIARDRASEVVRGFEDLLQRTDRTSTKTGQSIGEGLSRGSRSARNEMISLQQQVARNETAAGNYAAAIQRLEQLMGGFTVTNRQTLQVENQLIQTRNKAIAEIERQAAAQKKLSDSNNTIANGFRGLQGVLGSLGVAFSAQQIVQFGMEAVQSANSLEKTKATALALSGSQSKYNQLLQLATEGQRRYGGSLDGNIRGLSGLVNLSNRAGVSLASLDNISRRLATVDPVQGMEGAAYALKEFLSSDNASAAKSLIDRFELSPKLKDIATSGASAQEKIAALDAELNNLGISNDVLTNSTNTTAAAFDRLGAAWDNAKTRLGQGIQQILAPAADGAAQLLGMGDQVEGLSQKALSGSATFQDYQQKVNFANGQLNGLRAQMALVNPVLAAQVPAMNGLTEAQFRFAKSLVASGMSTQDAIAKARELGITYTYVQGVQSRMANAQGQSKEATQALADQMLRIASLSTQDQTNMNQLSSAYMAGRISAAELKTALDSIEGTYARTSAATKDHTQVTAENIGAVREQAAAEQAKQALQNSAYGQSMAAAEAQRQLTGEIKTYKTELDNEAATSLTASVSAETLTLRKQALEQQARAAAAAIQQGGGNIEAAAARLASSSNLVDVLTAAYLRLASAQAAAGQANSKMAGAAGALAGLGGGQGQGKKVTEEQFQADLALARAKGDINGQIKLLRQSQDGLNASSAKYKAIEAEIISLQKSGKKGGGGGGTSAAAKAAKATAKEEARTEGQITENQIKEQQKREDAERDYQVKRLEIAKQFAEKRVEAEKDLAQGVADADADFYTTLVNMKDQKTANKFNQQYQADLANLPNIAREKGADVADAYWSQYEQIATARAQRAAEIEEAKAKKDKGRVTALEGVDQIARKSEDMKLKRTLEGKGSVNEQEQQATTEAAQAYDEKMGDITQASDQAADKIERASLRRQEALKNDAAAATKAAQAYADYNRVAGGDAATGGAAATPSASGGTSDAAATPTPSAPAIATPTPTGNTSVDAAVGQVLQALAQVANAITDLTTPLENIRKATDAGSGKVVAAIGKLNTGRTS